MATVNSTRARGVQVEDYQWGRYAKGTREMLIKYGYAQDGAFPGDPDVKKHSIQTTDSAGREIKIARASKYLFVVSRDWSEEENAAYRKRVEHQEEIKRAQKEVESWHKSAGSFRDEASKAVETCLMMIESYVTKGARGGYRYDDDTVLRFQLMADQIMGLVNTGAIVKDLELREQNTPACIAKTVRAANTAKQDKSFQRFMADIAK